MTTSILALTDYNLSSLIQRPIICDTISYYNKLIIFTFTPYKMRLEIVTVSVMQYPESGNSSQ